MPEIADWKQKYRDALRESEREEKRWRQIEQALRQLIGRLCAAGMGVNPQLDDQLVAIAAANRRNADTVELARLAASLTTAVAAVDAVSPVAGVNTTLIVALPWTSTHRTAGTIVQSLGALGVEDEISLALADELTRAHSDAAVAAVLSKAAELIQACGKTRARERGQATAVLSGVTKRLEEVADYLPDKGNQARPRFADTGSLNDTVILHARPPAAEVNGATELDALQALVDTRLEAVTRQLLDLRAREDQRLLKEQTGPADSEHAWIADFESAGEDANSKLSREQQDARLDPLTHIANRKSFEERLAQEMGRLSQGNPPATLLLWDLDNFEAINDTYGHRVGDRVLQSVATCLASRLGTEEFVARVGGEEFVIVLNRALSKAVTFAEELRRSVELLRFHFRGTPVRVTASCGLTELRVGDAGGAAYDRADRALYQAKSGGKNACVAA
ncbi:MAG: diguanylate cyclase [Pseudomonadota bacterium]|nr:diguanylate cyclase [Pseudomonadota bacterium]